MTKKWNAYCTVDDSCLSEYQSRTENPLTFKSVMVTEVVFREQNTQKLNDENLTAVEDDLEIWQSVTVYDYIHLKWNNSRMMNVPPSGAVKKEKVHNAYEL